MYNGEFVQFTTEDGLLLPGLLFAAPDSKKVAVHLHGNGSASVFYRHGYETAQILNKKGISLLMFNNRGAHIIKKFTIKKGEEEERVSYGTSFEKIKECVFDIDAAVEFLKARGFNTFYLYGHSTGANKICVYNHYKPEHVFSKFVIEAGGDDTGLHYDELGKEQFFRLLNTAKEKIETGAGEEFVTEIFPSMLYSYAGFYDVCNPDGDYNCFPYIESLKKIVLSTKPLYRYFKEINTPSALIYGANDEYAWGNATACAQLLESMKPEFAYHVVQGADHGFHGKSEEVAGIVADYLSA
jgi:dienelactone hydrolase